MYNALSFTLILVVVPVILGELICVVSPIDCAEKKESKPNMYGILFTSGIYRFLMGLMAELAIWAIMATPYMILFTDSPFHFLISIYVVVIVILCIFALLWKKQKQSKNLLYEINTITNSFRDYMGEGSQIIYSFILVFFVGIQLFQTIYFAPVGYVNDDHHYFPEILNTVYCDQLQFYGFKRVLAPWYAFLAFISSTTGIHSLILCRTIMPAYLIVVCYMLLYVYSRFCFLGNTSKMRIFMMWSAIVVEALSYSYYLIFMTVYISVYGKAVSGMVGVPLLLLTTFAMMMDELGGRKELEYGCFILFVIGMGVAMFSFASLIASSVGLFLMMIVMLVVYRKKRVILLSASAELPFIIQILLYLFIK